MAIGDEVKKLRLERGWNASELARRAGLPPATVTRVERGISQPTSATVAKLAAGLGVDPGALFPKAASSSPSPVDRFVDAVGELEEILENDPTRLRRLFEESSNVFDSRQKVAANYLEGLPSGRFKDAEEKKLGYAQGALARLLLYFVKSQQDLTIEGEERAPHRTRTQVEDSDTAAG